MEESWVGNDAGRQRNSERYAKASKILRNSVVLLQTPVQVVQPIADWNILFRFKCENSQKYHCSHLNSCNIETGDNWGYWCSRFGNGTCLVSSDMKISLRMSKCDLKIDCFKVKAMEKDAAVGERFLVSSETGYTQVSLEWNLGTNGSFPHRFRLGHRCVWVNIYIYI